MNKILASTKELLGIPEEVTDFDTQLVIYINMVLMTLNQLGFGTAEPYVTTDTTGDLATFLPDDEGIRSTVQMYIYTKVRLLFDPPTSSFVLATLQTTINEYEWRLTNYTPVAPS